ncbi:MAG: nucleotide-binding universal stress UspA family protein [Saprospiraceae bacterium]|jgi:nucleotide-binding universal stress UspA family protein|uniref:universal stress protein n=1 Tax=Patiriisocius sp. Uisw_047 TaxID=3230969 RepID=UPI0039E8138F
MKRILVPTDFSEQADNALRVAVQIAEKQECEIYLLHSMELPSHLANGTGGGAMPEALFFIKLAEKQFEELAQKDYLQGVRLNQALGHGEIYNDIKEAAANKEVDLVVMGSHGVNGFKEMFIGSNTEKVVRTSSIPVLVIKNSHPTFKTENFVFATDFSEECRNAFNDARKFAKKMNAKMHLLYVNTPSGFKTTPKAYELMESFVKDMGAENYTLNVYNDVSVEKGILGFAADNKVDIIGMSTHGRKGIAHFFNGSISEDLVNHAQMPVITFKI